MDKLLLELVSLTLYLEWIIFYLNTIIFAFFLTIRNLQSDQGLVRIRQYQAFFKNY